MEAQQLEAAQPFGPASADFDCLVAKLGSPEAAVMTHSQVEELLFQEGNELLRKLFQGYLDSLGNGVCAKPVRGPEGAERTHRREEGRNLLTRFGAVRVSRMGYGLAETPPVHPLDAQLNLPPQLYSFGLERLVAQEVSQTSFSQAVATIDRVTGAHVPKRQAEEAAIRAALDFDPFYAQASRAAALAAADGTGPILVITADGKGVVMRLADLREETRATAELREHKLTTRLSKGEKRNSKRMAEVTAVYTIQPHVRTAEEVIGRSRLVRDTAKDRRPRPENKRVGATLKKEAWEAIEEAFQEASRRDPDRKKQWVVLVDGNKAQLKLVKQAAKRHGVSITIVVDFIHALEYLWKAGRELLGEGPDSEKWVLERALRLLAGEASSVAAGIRRSATKRGLRAAERTRMDACANYLLKNSKAMPYDVCLARGYPIATGVIEGACRHLVKDRMDLTGAHWGLERAEAVLQLRALVANGDFDAYWTFHERQEHQRNHASAFYKGTPPPVVGPRATAKAESRACRSNLRVVRP